MLDTGAEPNLIKVSMLKIGTLINAKDRLTLQGITEGRAETLDFWERPSAYRALRFPRSSISFGAI